MTIKAFLATDDDGETYIYLIDNIKWLQKDEDGDWNVHEIDCESANIRDNYDMGAVFGWLSNAISDELDRIHIPSKGEDPVEVDINISLNWY